jgi:hypothetical protein
MNVGEHSDNKRGFALPEPHGKTARPRRPTR